MSVTEEKKKYCSKVYCFYSLSEHLHIENMLIVGETNFNG